MKFVFLKIYMVKVNLMSMKFEFIFLILSLYIEVGNHQILTPRQMKNITATIYRAKVNESVFIQAEECWLKQQNFPEIKYTYYWCLVNEDHHPEVINSPNLVDCSGYDCWESQLTDVSRYEMLFILNRYRQKVASGTCENWCQSNRNTVVREMRWASYLEKLAAKSLANCSSKFRMVQYPKTEEIPEFNSEDHVYVLRETVIVSFATQTGLQREMRLLLWKLISENYLLDWNEAQQFERNGATDVGCAYLVRRGINFTTALNENVVNGNVGYLSCVYDTPINKIRLPTFSQPPSLEACKDVLEGIIVPEAIRFNDSESYFPLLCNIQPLNFIIPSHTFCTPWETHQRSLLCKKSDIPLKSNEKTWKEKPYGMIIRSNDMMNLECNFPDDLPEPSGEGHRDFENICTLKNEVFVEGDSENCVQWNCLDSQLTDVTKIQILNSLNTARELVATGKCSPDSSEPEKYCTKNKTYCNIAKLQWHWFLEWKAKETVKFCPTSYETTLVEMQDGPFDDPVVYEKITLIFKLPASEGQTALGRVFSQLFWKNAFNDWSETYDFRRGNALYIGCAVIIRETILSKTENKFRGENEVSTHMVCIYAALRTNFFSVPGLPSDDSCCQKCTRDTSQLKPCQTSSVKKILPFPNLCTSNIFKITRNCPVDRNLCSENFKSTAWDIISDDSTIYQDVDGRFRRKRDPNETTTLPEQTTLFTLPATYDPPGVVVGDLYKKKYCWILRLFFLMLLTLLALLGSLLFKYRVEKRTFEQSY